MKKNNIFKIVNMTKKYWKYLFGRSLGAVISASLTIFGAYVWGKTVDLAIQGDIDKFVTFVWIVALFVIVRSILNYSNPLISLKYSANSMKLLRSFFVSKIIEFPISFFDKNHSGDTISKLTSGLNEIEDFLDNSITNYIFIPVQILVGVIYLLFINWKLLLISLIIVPPITILSNKLSKKLKGSSKNIQTIISKSNIVFRDMINGIQIFKVFNGEKIFDEKVKDIKSEYITENKVYEKQNSFLMPLSTISSYLALIINFTIGGYFAFKGEITAGELVIFIHSLGFMSGALSAIPRLFASTQRANGVASYLLEMTTQKPEHFGKKIINDQYKGNVIQFKNVTFSYKNNQVLRNINVDIKKNSTIAIVGESGAGKTTLFNLLCGFYKADEGVIRVYGDDIKSLNIKQLRKNIAIVSQDSHLYNKSIYENIRYGNLKASDNEIKKAAKISNAHEFIKNQDKGYHTLVGERGVHLSGGQKQRIAIARAIINDSNIILFDEATSSLDNESQQLVQNAIIKMRNNKTLIIIAHRLSTIIKVDEILVLDKGSIVEKGTHEKLMTKKGYYYSLYNSQMASTKVGELL